MTDVCQAQATALQTSKRRATMRKSLDKNKVMVQDLASGRNLRVRRNSEGTIGISLYNDHGVAAAVIVAAGNSPGVEAGILPALTSAGSFILGLFMSSNVTPASTFVRPITGGSPLFTNSYKPALLLDSGHSFSRSDRAKTYQATYYPLTSLHP